MVAVMLMNVSKMQWVLLTYCCQFVQWLLWIHTTISIFLYVWNAAVRWILWLQFYAWMLFDIVAFMGFKWLMDVRWLQWYFWMLVYVVVYMACSDVYGCRWLHVKKWFLINLYNILFLRTPTACIMNLQNWCSLRTLRVSGHFSTPSIF